MAKTKEKKPKGEITMKVYDDFSTEFVLDGDDQWLAAGLASGLEDARFYKIVGVAIQTALYLTDLEEEKASKKAAKKDAAPKKKAADKKK